MKPIYLVKADPRTNTNKFYRMIPIYDEKKFIVDYGRINGASYQSHVYEISEWYKKLNEKLYNKKYQDYSHGHNFKLRINELIALGMIDDIFSDTFLGATIATIHLFNGNAIFIKKASGTEVTCKLIESNAMGTKRERSFPVDEIDENLKQFISSINIDAFLFNRISYKYPRLSEIVEEMLKNGQNVSTK